MAEKEYRIKESSLNKIGDSIREKTNSTTLYSVSEMPDAIRSISTVIPEGYIKPEGVKDIAENGSYDVTTYAEVQVHVEERVPEQEKELEVVHNGTYTITPDTDYVLNKAVVKVNVADIPAVLQEREIEPTRQEQIVAPDLGYEGMSKVVVKAIPSEYVIPEGNLDITDTNEFDASNYATAKIKDDNLKPENIAEGVEVLGIEGIFKGGIDTSDGTITSDKVLKNEVGYAKEQRVVGTIETWDGSYEGDAEIYNPLSDVLKGVVSRAITKITAKDLEGLTSIGDYAFYGCSLTEVEIPNTVTTMGRSCFQNNLFEKFVIPDSVTNLSLYIVQNCTNLKEVTIGKGVKQLGNGVFDGCTALEYVEIPDNVTGISWYVFQRCSNLKKVKFGTGITSISGCFSGCNSLKEIICLAETPPKFDAQNLTQLPADCIFYVPSGSVEAYKAATNWSARADYIVAYEEV